MSVTIYTQTTCAPCKMLKAWLNNKQVEYKEFNVDNDPSLIKKIIELSGRMMVPVIVIGEQVISGLDFSAVSQALEGFRVYGTVDPQDALACEGCQ